MNKIIFEELSEHEIEVTIPVETPMEMVQELTKSLIAKGLVEDLKKSTLSTRYFFRPQDEANQLADKLIKSLENMGGLNKAKKHWWAESQADVDAWKAKNRAIDRENKLKNSAIVNAPKPTTPSPSGPNTLPNVSNKLHNPQLSSTVDYYNKDTKKSEVMHKEDASCNCSKCDVKKSKPSVADSIRNKANKGSLNKSWANHNSIPSAEQELLNLAKQTMGSGEDLAANQLAKMMQNNQMLKFNQPSSQEFTAAGEAMGLGVSEQVLKSEQQSWNNTMNSWLIEATKPISQRFASEEEEIAYWSKLKVSDKADDVD